ncbi:MAG: triose-phosphate isomerase, partial [Flavobacteriales bacterium]|nr:triose-phosphate isomerase [Flavobacteriales bacterium]
DAVALAQGVARGERPAGVEVIVAPPFPYLEAVVSACDGCGAVVAAQNCHAQPPGAYTGEVSGPRLKDLGAGA